MSNGPAAGAEAAHKHLQRVWRIASGIAAEGGQGADGPAGEEALALERATHRAIRDVTADIEGFAFNKAVARLYEFTNTIAKSGPKAGAARVFAMKTMAQLMAPMIPHLAEEIWSELGGEGLVVKAPWPQPDPEMLVEQSVTLPIQINGKRRGELSVPADADKSAIEALVLANEVVAKALDGGAPRKLIVVPGRIVNVVV